MFKIITATISFNVKTDLPTKAKMTVSRGAAGKLTVTLNSNICRRSTEKQNHNQ